MNDSANEICEICFCPQTALYDQEGYVVAYVTLHTKQCTVVSAKL